MARYLFEQRFTGVESYFHMDMGIIFLFVFVYTAQSMGISFTKSSSLSPDAKRRIEQGTNPTLRKTGLVFSPIQIQPSL